MGKNRTRWMGAPLGFVLFMTGGGAEGVKPPPPVPAQLQAGDLIWPKKPQAVVPFNSRPGEAKEGDAAVWNSEKNLYLEKLRNASNPSPQERESYDLLQNMSYAEFQVLYLGGRTPGEPANYSTSLPYVGHVGIVDIVNGSPVIIEAVMGQGVRRIAYDDWLRERPGELIWLARLKDVPPEKRSAVAKAAADNVGKPYHFWNFNLLDNSGFYCSKLAWYSIWSGAGFAPDDNPSPDRSLWYSPRKLMESKRLDLIVNPGSYGSPN